MRIKSLVAVSALCLGGLGVAPAAAQSVAPGEPQISIYLRGVRDTGGIGGWAGDTRRFAVGEPFTMFLVAGRLPNASICSAGAYSSRSLDELIPVYAHVWRIAVTPLEYAAGRQKFTLDWARFGSSSPDKPVAGGTQELTLKQGDRQVLDFLHGGPGAANCSRTALMLDVAAGYHEDAAFADAMLKYELWLVHTDPTSGKVTHQFVTMGMHGAETAYGFPSLRFDVPALPGVTRQYDVKLLLDGTIRGRLTPGGKVVVELTTGRRDAMTPRVADSVARSYSESPFGDSGSGRKVLEVTPGETIEIKIPSRGGVTSVRAGDAPPSGSGFLSARPGAGAATAPAEPIEVADGRIRVNWKRFFEGHETSLLLRVTRVQ